MEADNLKSVRHRRSNPKRFREEKCLSATLHNFKFPDPFPLVWVLHHLSTKNFELKFQVGKVPKIPDELSYELYGVEQYLIWSVLF